MYRLSDTRFGSIGWLSGAAALLVIGHTFFLFAKITEPTQGTSGEVLFWLCVAPVLLVGCLDFRAALLFSIVSIPIFNAPKAYSGLFTQGTGDLFALIVVCSFLFSHWRQVIRVVSGSQLQLLLIPAAAILSTLLNLPNSDTFQWNQIKYSVAEFGGLSLGVAYSLLLTFLLRDERDFQILLRAVFIALVISVIQGFASLILMTACMPDLAGTVISPGGQISGGFGNPNYYGNWLLTLLPIVLYKISQQNRSTLKRIGWSIMLITFLLFLLLTVSRSTLLTLVFLCFAWWAIVKGWIYKVKAIVVVLMIAIFFPAAWNIRFEACNDVNHLYWDYVSKTNTIVMIESEIFGKFLHGKTTDSLEIQLNESGHEYPSRSKLLFFSWEAWLSSPVIGIGPGNLAFMVKERTGIGERAHNVVATVLAEQGALGLFVWLILFVTVFWRIWRVGWGSACKSQHHAIQGKYLFLIFLSLSITSLFSDQYRATWLWLFIGIIFSPYFSSNDRATVVPRNDLLKLS